MAEIMRAWVHTHGKLLV